MPRFTDGNGDRKFIAGKGRKQDLDLSAFDRESARHDKYVDAILSKHKEDPSKNAEKDRAEAERRAALSKAADKERKAAAAARKKAKIEHQARMKRIVARAKKDADRG